MCREAVASSRDQDAGRLSEGIYWGIVTMLGMPFLLFGIVTFAIVRAMRRARKRAAAAGPRA
jgi:hypothetical protein